MPRLLLVVDQVAPRRGMERAVADLIEALREDVDIQVVALSGARPEGFPVSLRLLGLPPSPLRFVLGPLKLRRTLARSTKEGRAVVGVGVWATLVALLALGFRRGVRVSVWEHSILPWRLSHDKRVRVIAFMVYKIRRLRISQIVAVSRPVKSAVDELTGSRVPSRVIPNVLPNAVSPVGGPSRSGVRVSGDRTTLLGVGGLVELKNWSLAIEALQHLPEHFCLALAGDGPDRTRLERVAEAHGVAHRVFFLGFRQDVDRLLSEADIVVHPSFVETFGYSLYEAAQAGRPVVCIDMPVMNEVIPGLLPGIVCGNAPQSFAEGVRLAAEELVPRPHAFTALGNQEEVRASWLEVLSTPGRG